MKKSLENNSWYQELLNDLKKLEFTGIVLTKWNIGKRILEEFEKLGKPEYGNKRIETLAKDLGVSAADLYKCIQFAKKYPKIITPLQNLSWRDVVNNFLPEPRKEINIPKLPIGKYQVIYADPPWQYNDTCESGAIQHKGADKHYPVMSIHELCNLEIPSAENSVLFLWVTSPLLEECFSVINAWGFKYKASFVWDKIKHNMGHYNSVRHEFLLICTKGEFTPLNIKLFDSVVSIERTKHSEKPEEFYEIIETLYPNCKYLELFARKKRENWTSWGNEI